MAFAEVAIGQIKSLRQTAVPRNYEIWFTYATGYNPSLNQKINELLKEQGTLSDADLDEVYEAYLAPSRLTERIDTVGSKVMGEIEQVMAMIDMAAGTANSYSESLAEVGEKLGQSKGDREGLRAIPRIAARLQLADPIPAGDQGGTGFEMLLELGLVEKLVDGRLAGERRVVRGVVPHVGRLIAGQRRADEHERAGDRLGVDLVVADLADGDVPSAEPIGRVEGIRDLTAVHSELDPWRRQEPDIPGERDAEEQHEVAAHLVSRFEAHLGERRGANRRRREAHRVR